MVEQRLRVTVSIVIRAGAILALSMGGLGLFRGAEVSAQIPLNLGFERPAVEGFVRPWGWNLRTSAEGAAFIVDSVVRRSGGRSLRIAHRRDGATAVDTTFAHALSTWIAPRFAWGDTIRVTGWIRGEGLDGQGRLVLEAWGAETEAADTAAISSTADPDVWHPVHLAIPVDSSAHSIYITAGLVGTGTVWFDDLEVETRGRVWNDVPAATAPGAADLDWLAARTHPFASVDLRTGADDFADMEPFGAIVADARVVALGEATHGTSEFFRIKHRLLAYLVERAGFRVFAIEANQLAVEPINQYVHGGPGEVRTLMRAMFRVWNTEEMQALIEWMREYNANHPERMVEFVGFDMQDPRLPIDSVSAFVRRVEPALHGWVDSLYAPYREAWGKASYPQGSDAVRQSWYASASDVYDRVHSMSDGWMATATSRADSMSVDWVIQNANVVRQAALSALAQDLSTRDSAMAENIQWMLARRPLETRMVIWAHDGHISRAEHPSANYWGGGAMGGTLSRMLGDDYRAFGLLTYSGSYAGSLGPTIIDTRLLNAPVGSLEEALHRLGQRLHSPLLITDIRNAAHDPAGAWLLEPRVIRMIGYAAEDIGFATDIAVGSQFDGIIFMERTSPSHVFR
jgi:erythromycin esterase